MAGYFSVLLVVLTLVSGLLWLLDAKVFKPRRTSADVQPYWAETAQSIFPLIAAITFFRSFLYEPFQIPSGSMMPTLLVGDFILVEKFAYDVKDPVWRTTLIETGKPERGDIVVFKFPRDPRIDYIKRVIGTPGDRIVYRNKQIFIQKACDATAGKACPGLEPLAQEFKADGEYFQGPFPQKRFTETSAEASHDILVTPNIQEFVHNYYVQPGTPVGEFVVPEGQYFVMGDNRDNSEDGRFWGFVPEQNLVGKAVFKWMSFEFSEDPNSWLPSFVPVGVRFSRLGTLH